MGGNIDVMFGVSTHSHLKVAAKYTVNGILKQIVSTHSHLKVAAKNIAQGEHAPIVSTHSHLKVAAFPAFAVKANCLGFNTQPPEGGCHFQLYDSLAKFMVSTHSHLKVAAEQS